LPSEPLRSRNQEPLAGRGQNALHENQVREESNNNEAVETEAVEKQVVNVQWETFGNFESHTLEPKESAEALDEDDHMC
jgi:hypothetical protein